MPSRYWTLQLAVWTLILTGPTFAGDSAFCFMPKDQVANSDDCLRYYLECNQPADNAPKKGEKTFVSPLLKDLSPKDMLELQKQGRRIGVQLQILEAAKACKHFSYIEGYSAFKLKSLE